MVTFPLICVYLPFNMRLHFFFFFYYFDTTTIQPSRNKRQKRLHLPGFVETIKFIIISVFKYEIVFSFCSEFWGWLPKYTYTFLTPFKRTSTHHTVHQPAPLMWPARWRRPLLPSQNLALWMISGMHYATTAEAWVSGFWLLVNLREMGGHT